MRIFFIFVLVALLSSCAQWALNNELENLKKVKVGMSRNQVIEILDDPKHVNENGNEKWLSWNGSIVIMKNNKVVNAVEYTEENQPLLCKVDVEAFSNSKPDKKIAQVISSKSSDNVDDIEFKHVKKMVESILIKNGYRISENQNEIDTVVAVTYGISDPKTISKTFSTPVYDYEMPETPEDSNTSHDVYNQFGQNVGRVESKTTHGNPYQIKVPKQVYKGERIHTVDETTFTRFIILDAIDFKKFKVEKQMKSYWRTNAVSEGSSNNLSQIISNMLIQTEDYIEEDTFGKVELRIFLNDPRSKELLYSNRKPASK